MVVPASVMTASPVVAGVVAAVMAAVMTAVMASASGRAMAVMTAQRGAGDAEEERGRQPGDQQESSHEGSAPYVR